MRRIENEGGSGGGRFRAQFTGRRAAIQHVNDEAMKDHAYEHVYGVKVLRRHRRPLMWLAAHEAKYSRHPTASKLGIMVEQANDCSEPSARKDIKWAEDHGLLSSERDGTEVFYFLSPEQREKFNLLTHFLSVIPKSWPSSLLHRRTRMPGRNCCPKRSTTTSCGK